MVYLFTGTPGSGKSLHMADIIRSRLKYHHPTIANFHINIGMVKGARAEDFSEVDNLSLTPDFLKSYAVQYFRTHKFGEDKIALFIDECQLIFNCREWNAKGREQWVAFFTQHRKFGYRIYLISQFDSMVDKQVRSLVEYQVIHRKLSNFGLKGKLISFFMGGNMFVGVNVWYPLKERIGADFFRYRKKLGDMYDSYKTFDSDNLIFASDSSDSAPESVPDVPSVPQVEDVPEVQPQEESKNEEGLGDSSPKVT